MLEMVQLLQDRDPPISQPSSRLREAKPPPGHMRHPAGERNCHSVVLGSSGSPEQNVDSSSTLLLLIHVLSGGLQADVKKPGDSWSHHVTPR